MLDDTTVLDRALKILDEINMSMQKRTSYRIYANLKYKTRIPIAQTIGISYCFTFKKDYYGR